MDGRWWTDHPDAEPYFPADVKFWLADRPSFSDPPVEDDQKPITDDGFALPELILADRNALWTDLLQKSQPVFDGLDRHRAEGEFRIAIAIPLAVLAVVSALVWCSWSVAVIAAGSAVLALGIAVDGLQRESPRTTIFSGG